MDILFYARLEEAYKLVVDIFFNALLVWPIKSNPTNTLDRYVQVTNANNINVLNNILNNNLTSSTPYLHHEVVTLFRYPVCIVSKQAFKKLSWGGPSMIYKSTPFHK